MNVRLFIMKNNFPNLFKLNENKQIRKLKNKSTAIAIN